MASQGSIINRVRAAAVKHDLRLAQRLIRDYRQQRGTSPELLEARSWLARGALAKGLYTEAVEYGRPVRRSVIRRLRGESLDSEPHLASALGASIEVVAQSLAQRSRRSDAVRFLKGELGKYGATSIRTRIRKNLNLLTLEGRAAPALEIREWLGPKPLPFSKLLGHPIILFFWARYCDDSRAQARVLGRIWREFIGRGLVLIAPTRAMVIWTNTVGNEPDRDKKSSTSKRCSSGIILSCWEYLSPSASVISMCMA